MINPQASFKEQIDPMRPRQDLSSLSGGTMQEKRRMKPGLSSAEKEKKNSQRNACCTELFEEKAKKRKTREDKND